LDLAVNDERHWSIYWPAHLTAALYLTCIVLLAWLTA
jgi:hypothetical protein